MHMHMPHARMPTYTCHMHACQHAHATCTHANMPMHMPNARMPTFTCTCTFRPEQLV
jgi:hypothetical protein